MLLSGCMLTLNEAAHLALSVPAALATVDELVVIDGGSQDGTVALLEGFGPRVRVEVVPQSGDPYSADWRQEERRERLQTLCRGEWVLQIDADEVLGDEFPELRRVLAAAPPETVCFGVWRLDYAPDLRHGFLPYTAHPSIPRVWRRGGVTWLTGKSLHMEPYLTGTTTPASLAGPPAFRPLELLLHHVHRANWIGKAREKVRREERGRPPMSRASRLGSYAFAVDRVPRAVTPAALRRAADGQKAALMAALGVAEDPFDTAEPDPPISAQGFFLPSNEAMLTDTIRTLPNPLLFVEIGSWLGASTRFLAGRTGGCVVAIDHWRGSDEHRGRADYSGVLPMLYRQFLANCRAQRDRILPLRMTSADALALPLRGIDLLYVDGAHDYDSVLFDLRSWSSRMAAHGVICGDDWLWGDHRPVQKAVQDFAAETGRRVEAKGNFWRLSAPGAPAR